MKHGHRALVPGLALGAGMMLGLGVSLVFASDLVGAHCSSDSFCPGWLCPAAEHMGEWCSCCSCATLIGLSERRCKALWEGHGCTKACEDE